MSSPKIFLHRAYKKKDGSVAVYIIVHIDYQTVKFPTGICCKPENFNEEAQRIRGTSKKVKDDNLTIEKALATINEIMVRYRLTNETLTAELLKNEWKNPSRRVDFYSFLDEAIKERKPDLANQTYKNHNTMASKLKEFRSKLAFSEITTEFLEKFARWMKVTKKNDINTVHTSMKFLKTYIRIAIKKGIIEKNPFDDFKVLQVKTERIYLSKKELKSLWELYTSNKLSRQKQNNLRHFLFMCFTGVRISDFRNLTKFNVVDDVLAYSAIKTARLKRVLIKVPLTEQAKMLIKDENSQTESLFNPVSDQKLNKYIKEICKSNKINKEITNHSARHTFATLWLEETNDLASLQKLLGHSRILDTMVYVHLSDASIRKSMSKFNPVG